MAADILMFGAHRIPVGRDQIQHVEMARDIAQRFNHNFAEVFTLPEAVVDDDVAVLQGLDGRKMSKSYNNTIPLFEPEKKLRKSINKVRTNLLEPGEPKSTEDSTLFQLWCAFADQSEIERMRTAFAEGIAWGEAKKQLFELVNDHLAPAREKYIALMDDPAHIEQVLRKGAARAREISAPLMRQVREAVGIAPMG
jgi:tryptophanyl-tRNA synthetase